MSIYPSVTEQDLFNLRKSAEELKNQRGLKIISRFLKQSNDIKVAQNLSPINKKLEEVNKSTQK